MSMVRLLRLAAVYSVFAGALPGCLDAHALEPAEAVVEGPEPEAGEGAALAPGGTGPARPHRGTAGQGVGQDGAPAPAGMGGSAALPPTAPPDWMPTPFPGTRPPSSAPPPFTESEVELYSTFSPLGPVPPDTTNAVADSAAAAQLGRALFEDEHFSGPLKVASELGAVGDQGKVSCATCHFGPALADPSPVSTGTGAGTRNSLALVNSAHHRWINWGGRFSAQWELSVAVVENPAIMNGSRLRVAHRVFDAHRAAYEQVFGAIPVELADRARFPAEGKPKPAATPAMPEPPNGAWEAMSASDQLLVNRILVNYGKAIAAFLRTIVSGRSPFDAFVVGDSSALDPEAQAGLRLFMGKARCIVCHNGPLFADGAFHNLGVPVRDGAAPIDDGRFKDIPGLLASPFSSATSWSDDPGSGRLAGLTTPPPEETRGQFRTPSLRGVAQSAPYMHNGLFADLREVIAFYSWGGGEPASGVRDRQLVPLHLTDHEIEQLVAFLESLTGEPVDPSLTVDERPTW